MIVSWWNPFCWSTWLLLIYCLNVCLLWKMGLVFPSCCIQTYRHNSNNNIRHLSTLLFDLNSPIKKENYLVNFNLNQLISKCNNAFWCTISTVIYFIYITEAPFFRFMLMYVSFYFISSSSLIASLNTNKCIVCICLSLFFPVIF